MESMWADWGHSKDAKLVLKVQDAESMNDDTIAAWIICLLMTDPNSLHQF